LESIAFLGLGRMGEPMARSLVAAGYPLTVFNRTQSKARQLADELGVEVALTPAAAMQNASVAITMLADGNVLKNALTGADGLLEGAHPGSVVVDMGTTGPDDTRELREVAAEGGVALVDAPVSGSTAAAQAAALTIMVGADEDHYLRIEPILRAMGQRTIHVGPAGSGASLKLAINSAIFNMVQAVSEVLALAESCGVQPDAAYDVLEASAAAAPVVLYRRQQFLDPQGAPVTFTLDLTSKDLQMIKVVADRHGVPMPLTQTTSALVERAIDAGLGQRDVAALALLDQHTSNNYPRH